MPLKVRKQHAPEDICINCNKRKKHKSWPYCPPCRDVLIADGVIKAKKGIPLAVRYKQYCDLYGKGLTQQQIADKLGLDRSYVGNLVKRCRDMGWPIPKRGYHLNKITEHGGGVAGIRGCDCELCTAKRSEYKLNWRKERQEKLAKGLLLKPSRLSHGEGSRGIQYCDCDLCVQRRRDYKKEWKADVKAHGYKRQRNASVAQG